MRFHVHIAVEDLPASLQFYSQLFGTGPSKERPDYAKWLLVEPPVNFAISSRGHGAGVDHFGFQAETPEELVALKIRAEAASEGALLDQGEAACCYARSEKHWTADPQGLAWEHFLTMSDALTYGEDVATRDGACCIAVKGHSVEDARSGDDCCISHGPESEGACCG